MLQGATRCYPCLRSAYDQGHVRMRCARDAYNALRARCMKCTARAMHEMRCARDASNALRARCMKCAARAMHEIRCARDAWNALRARCMQCMPRLCTKAATHHGVRVDADCCLLLTTHFALRDIATLPAPLERARPEQFAERFTMNMIYHTVKSAYIKIVNPYYI